MKTDFTTKVLLSAIALALTVIAVKLVSEPVVAKAQDNQQSQVAQSIALVAEQLHHIRKEGLKLKHEGTLGSPSIKVDTE